VYSQNLANFLGFFSTQKQKKTKKTKKNPFFGVNHILKVAKM